MTTPPIASAPRAFNDQSLIATSLTELLDMGAEAYFSRPAFSMVLPNGTSGSLSFAQVKQASDAVATYLRDVAGLQPGDVVAMQAPNCLAYPVVASGILKAGLIMTGINPLYTAPETRHQLHDSGAKILFTIDLFADRLGEALQETDVQTVIALSIADFLPAPKRQALKTLMKLSGKVPKSPVEMTPLNKILAAGRKRLVANRIDVADYTRGRDPHSPVLYQYTSGTTGRSKGAEMTEYNILANLSQLQQLNGDVYNPGTETALVILPMYHVYALTFACLQAARHGIHNVLMPQPRPLVNLKLGFERYPITILPGINTLFQGLLAEDWFTQNPPKHLRFCLSGAAALQSSIRQRWEDLTNCPIFEGYGLTECTCIVAFPLVDKPQTPGTVGVPVPGTQVRLLDEEGQEVPAGETGEIVVSGPQVVRGYFARPDATAEAIKDGWLHTGDMGRFDDDGQLCIVDRKKDMIIVSGFNVYPAELEDVLAQSDGVAEVAVVGAPDESRGEAPIAFVVRADSEAGQALSVHDLQVHAAKYLTNYKRPRDIRFVDALPKSPVGKVLRRELRDQV